nr:ankyrin repeat domain-containing protein [Endozoicomonas sp. ONNA2]
MDIFQLAVHFKNKENKTARDLAIQNGHREVAEACRGFLAKILKIALSQDPITINIMNFVKHVVGIDHSLARDTDNNGNTALHQGAESGRTNIVKAWLAIDSSLVEETNRDGNTALHLAAQNGHTGTIQAFLCPEVKETVMEQLFTRDEVAFAYLLGTRDPEKDAISVLVGLFEKDNKDGNKALYLAAQNGYTDTVMALLDIDFINQGLGRKSEHALLDYTLKACQIADQNGHPETATELRGPMLHLAVKNGDKRVVMELLQIDGSLARKRDEAGDMALHVASLKSRTEIVQVLLDFDPSLAKDKGADGKTPHHHAAGGDEESLSGNCLELLIGAEPDIDATDNSGNTPLHLAAKRGYSGCVKLLLDAGADIKANNKKKTPLHLATQKKEEFGEKEKCKGCVELLTEAGADIDATDKHGNTPLNNAAASDLFGCGKFLLDAGADIKANLEGESPLHKACYGQGNHHYVRLLIEKGADINAADNSGNTALHHAAKHRNTECMKLLLDAGAIIKSNKDGKSPINLATPKCKRLFQNREANLYPDSTMRREQIEQLCSVAKEDNVQKLKDLLSTWLNIKVSDDNGKTALHYVAENGGVECLKHLLDNSDVNINLRDNSKKTACHYAAKNGHIECLKYLFNRGVNINLTDGSEKSVLHYAIEYEMQNAESNAKDKSNTKETCLDYLSRNGYEFSPSNIFLITTDRTS